VHILFLAISADYWTKLEKGKYGKKVPEKKSKNIAGMEEKMAMGNGMGKCVNCMFSC
jgi:hypothetical protein